ncbi:hypothetical protein PATSB16_05610 [Pandoraea thiooxydans]|nr:hypothetical protein PATSB16_05610 [Pandoraea thiooxydans]
MVISPTPRMMRPGPPILRRVSAAVSLWFIAIVVAIVIVAARA